MANQWFRMYSEFASDPKVQMMNEADQRRFVMVLCMRCSNDNVTLHDEEIAFQLRISNEQWAATKAVFLAKNLINKDNTPTAWDKRQFVSDSSAERVARHRAKKKQGCNVTETPPEAEADTEADIKTKPQAAALDQLAPGEPPGNAAALADPILTRAIEITVLLTKRGGALQASDPRVRAWAEQGVTDTQALQALDIANERRQQQADPRPINAGLLDAILGDIRQLPTANARASPRRKTVAEEREAVSIALTGRKPNHERPTRSAERDITADCQRLA